MNLFSPHMKSKLSMHWVSLLLFKLLYAWEVILPILVVYYSTWVSYLQKRNGKKTSAILQHNIERQKRARTFHYVNWNAYAITKYSCSYKSICIQKNPFLVVAIGDFNVKSKIWYINDSTTSQGNILENITSQFGLQQTIKEPTHILDHSS